MSLRFQSLITAFLLLMSAACSLESKTCEYMATDSIVNGAPDTIRVFMGSDEAGKKEPAFTSSDQTDINWLKNLIASKDNRWKIDALGVPVGVYSIVFYKEDTRLASVSIGPRFLVAQGCNYFASTSITNGEEQRIVEITGISVKANL